MATTPMPSSYRAMLKSLSESGVEFLVVGGWAVICHGYVRSTKDLDIWFDGDMHEARKVVRVLEQLNYSVEIDTIMRLSIQRSVLRLDHEPTGIDLMTSCDGCQWAEAWKRRVLVDLDGLRVPILSLRDLHAAKRAAGRHRDLDDLENLPTVDEVEDDASSN